MRLDLSALRFLIVDDNAHMRRIVRTLLHGFGVREIHEAEDGASGLEAVRNTSPDILILDWVMPILDGIEFVRTIRNPGSKLNPFVPIIMLSGHAEKRRVLEARDAGVHEFLCKPISAKALHDRIAAIVLHPRPFIQSKGYFGPDRRRFQNPNWSGHERRGLGGRPVDIEDFIAIAESEAKSIAL